MLAYSAAHPHVVAQAPAERPCCPVERPWYRVDAVEPEGDPCSMPSTQFGRTQWSLNRPTTIWLSLGPAKLADGGS